MLEQKVFKMLLRDIVVKIISGKISMVEISERVHNDLEANNIWDCENLLITDCYYALKHMQEENISIKEWEYFIECFNDYRQYNLEDKKHVILKN